MGTRQRLVASVVGSVLLHALLLSYVQLDFTDPPRSAVPPLELIIGQAPAVTEPFLPAATEGVEVAEIETVEPVEPVEPVEQEPAPPASRSVDVAPHPREILSAIAGRTQGDAFKVFVAPDCTPVEALVGLKKCPSPDLPDRAEETVFYAHLFKQAFGHAVAERQKFDSDMDRLDRLLASAANLESMQPTDEVHAALLRERTSHLRSEILSIDRQYAQFNLLRLIPMGKKAVKGLKELADG